MLGSDFLKIRQMRFFVEVCRCNNNLSKAAKNLCVSQPSVSVSIKELEKELGFRLFHRSEKKMFLTKNGEYVNTRFSHLLEETDSMIKDFSKISQTDHRIALGLPLHVGAYIMPLIFGEFHHKHPEIKFDLVELGGIDNMQLLENNELDLTISGHGNFTFPDIEDIEIFSGECCFCVNKRHPLAKRESIKLEETNGEQLVMLPSGSYVNRLINKLYVEKNMQPNVLVYTSQLHSLKSLIISNIASAFILRESIIFDEDIIPISLNEKINIPITISVKKGVSQSDDVKKLISYLKNKKFL